HRKRVADVVIVDEQAQGGVVHAAKYSGEMNAEAQRRGGKCRRENAKKNFSCLKLCASASVCSFPLVIRRILWMILPQPFSEIFMRTPSFLRAALLSIIAITLTGCPSKNSAGGGGGGSKFMGTWQNT